MPDYTFPPDMTNLQRFLVFLEVAERLSYSKAAHHLGISQPAVSNHIRILEGMTGTPLFHRDGHTLTLTEAGHAVVRKARVVTDSVQDMHALMTGLQGEVAGHLIVGASTIWEYALPEIMAEFRKRYPRVSLELQVGNSARIVDLLTDRQVHLGFTSDDTGGAELEAFPAMRSEIVVVARPDHPLSEGKPHPPEALTGQALVLREAGSATARVALDYLRSLGVTPGDVAVFGSHEALKAAVRAGFGLGMVSREAVRLELSTGVLRLVHLDAAPCVRQLYLLRRRSWTASPALRAFFMHVMEGLAT